jgi:hypothetical protein
MRNILLTTPIEGRTIPGWTDRESVLYPYHPHESTGVGSGPAARVEFCDSPRPDDGRLVAHTRAQEHFQRNGRRCVGH